MTTRRIDLRSDTVTQPTDAMRQVMAGAPVGDDVMNEDPTVIELERYTAELMGKDAAVFVPSGTMANQAAVRSYAGPGDEILAVDQCHLFFYEAGSAAGLSGVQIFPVPAVQGIFKIEDFRDRIRPEDLHFPVTRLFWVENTHNRGGGRIVPFELMKQLKKLSDRTGIPIHVDGARLPNASAATGIPLPRWTALCDSLSICLSKGLGAPVGSLIVGSETFIHKCRRARKAFGGGMRQAGIIAAGGLYALKNNLQRLRDDHRRASRLAEGLKSIPGLHIPPDVDTNIVMIDLDDDTHFDVPSFQDLLQKQGVLMFAVGPRRLRAVTHLGIDDQDIAATISIFKTLLTRAA
ncbi:low-specificity L-threonine aldolase [bacterium]|nr:low-specificity L-threonine aldolase [candidate division CSSED10-310 bacterium]